MTTKKPQSIEARGQTIDAAIEAGLARLGLDREAVSITIIDEGSRGLLGIGVREAVVQLIPLTDGELAFDQGITPAEAQEETREETKEMTADQTVTSKLAQETGDESSAAALELERETAIQVITELLQKMHVPAGVTAYLSDPDDLSGQQVNLIDITGDDLTVLIGPRGETLESLQYISRLMVSHKLQRRVNFVIDIEEYRQRRVTALTRLAERMADKVRQRGEPISLEPMSSYERRIIHMSLREAADVYTESVGEGKQRKVRIFPK